MNKSIRVEEVCRKMGISEATFYNWKKKFGGLGVRELRRLRQLKEENYKLKQIVADLTLDKLMLQDVLRKTLKAAHLRVVATNLMDSYRISITQGLQGRVVKFSDFRCYKKCYTTIK